ncbi:hypothetical protein GCM10009673_27670 [Nesterenkonia sandarakina]
MEVAIGVTVLVLGILGLINRRKIAISARNSHNRLYNTDKDGLHFAPFQVIIPSVGAIVCGLVFIAMGIFDG